MVLRAGRTQPFITSFGSRPRNHMVALQSVGDAVHSHLRRQRHPNGEIANAMGKKCVGAAGDVVALTACDGGSTWETQGNGTIFSFVSMVFCGGSLRVLRPVEVSPCRRLLLESERSRGRIGRRRCAWRRHCQQHGRCCGAWGQHGCGWQLQHVLGNLGLPSHYGAGAGWIACCFQASGLDPVGPVAVTVDLGSPKKLKSVGIQWEFPAKSFTVSVSTDGAKWSEVHATDSNILSSSSIALGSTLAAKVRVVMHEVGCACLSLSALWVLRALAGSRVFPWPRRVRHQILGCPRGPLAKHCGRLRGSRQKHRRSRQVLCNLC